MPWAILNVAGAALTGAALASVFWLSVSPRRRRAAESAAKLTLRSDLTDAPSVDAAAALILEQVSGWVAGSGYHLYWLTADRTSLRLRASIAPTSKPVIAPDYAGLVLDEEPALVPLSVLPDPGRTAPAMAGARHERWLELPLGPVCLIRVLSRPDQQPSAALLRELAGACAAAAPLTGAIDAFFRAQDELAAATRLAASMRTALDTTLRPDKAIELLVTMGGQMVDAVVAVAIVAGADQPAVIAATDHGRALGEEMLNDVQPLLRNLPPQPDVIPGASVAAQVGPYAACVRVPLVAGDADAAGCFFLFTHHAPALTAYQTAALRTLGERAGQLLINQRQMYAAASDYAQTLRFLVAAIDALSPHSQGHSDRLARYARMTAQELGLSYAQAEAVALAAYFHDVGMVSVDPRVVLKPQQLTEDEYARVRQHAELGARLVASLPAALPLAPIVAGHHERYHGHGYPRGLRGEEIPLGARIVAVADLFESKSTGRSYRSPLPFTKAMAAVQAAAGDQLDPDAVAAFTRAMSRLRGEAEPGKPPARCWEMKQLADHVCEGCPNRVAEVVRCWENPGNLCTRHGDRCEDCIVYTTAKGL